MESFSGLDWTNRGLLLLMQSSQARLRSSSDANQVTGTSILGQQVEVFRRSKQSFESHDFLTTCLSLIKRSLFQWNAAPNRTEPMDGCNCLCTCLGYDNFALVLGNTCVRWAKEIIRSSDSLNSIDESSGPSCMEFINFSGRGNAPGPLNRRRNAPRFCA